MGWSTRVMLVGLVALQWSAFGKQVRFQSGQKATLETHVLSNERLDSASVSPLEFQLSVPAIDLQKQTDGFTALTVEGLTPKEAYGSPEVFSTGSLIVVPQGYEASLQILQQEQQQVKETVLRPCQHQLRCDSKVDGFAFNNALYSSRGLYPAEVATLEEVGYVQNVHLMRVAFNPVQMDFANSALTVTTQLSVRVEFKQVADAKVVVVPKSVRQLLAGFTANGADVRNLVRANREPETLVVMVADSLKNAIAPLVTWKQQRGFNVKVVTFTEAGNTKEAAKAYLQKLYQDSVVKPSYLLFVGNNTTMPTYFESTGSGSAASDYQYALLANADAIPDLPYGRLAAENEKDVTTQINRWIAYEKEAMSETWYPQAMTIASNEGSGPSDKEYAVQIQDALKVGKYMKFDSFFQADKNATAQNITTALEEGRSWIAYFGHGTGTSWGSTNDAFNVKTVEGLKNKRLPFIVDVACQNASWVKIPKSFGKAWVTQETDGKATGAVAFYGGSVNISWHPPAVMSVGMAKSHFEKNITGLGANALAGQLYLIEKMGNSAATLDNVKWYNLLGDPTLLMRTANPINMHVKTRSVNPDELTVTATNDAGEGIANLTVSVTQKGRNPVAVGKTSANGEAVLNLGLMALEDPILTVTGYNMVTVQQPLN